MKNKKVLLVEDDVFLSNALQIELKRAHLDVTIALNGEQALKMVDDNKYDLVLLDIVMPVMDGWQVLKVLTERKVNTVIVSNLSQEEVIQRALTMGAKDFLVKSNNSIKEMLEKITKVLEETSKEEPETPIAEVKAAA